MTNLFLFSTFMFVHCLNPSFLYAGHKHTKVIRDDNLGEKEEKGATHVSLQRKSETGKIARKRRAASKGNANAQYDLGLMYEFGKNVTKNAGEARKWYEKAAAQGHAEAQLALGFYDLASKDSEKAMQWFQKAADQGFQPANEPLKNIKTTLMARKTLSSSLNNGQ